MLDIEIKILGVDELNDFRGIRLSALAKAPAMFGSTYDVEIVKPLSFFQSCLSNSTIFGVYHKDKIIGLAALIQESGIKLAHKAVLSSVFIEPEFQSQGIATGLLRTINAYSQAQVEQVLLTVAADNQSAIKLYQKMGFEVYGVEKKALKNNNEYTDELLRKLFLR
ncbi:GNAT family N-acetyltransferase [Acinetobacter courvalinii]|uniref:GNAT family N-acetyltransferase n=1 Tax=Acinetobacter courvalinii TaxID=280147 RepID=UPI0018FFEDA7|nr:GNAT family N-acetyltransferase [Acinetobacter courvalinii]MBJ9956400.1 GNAT family N-acetyltransferase [Acinetobacter courvalinii]